MNAGSLGRLVRSGIAAPGVLGMIAALGVAVAVVSAQTGPAQTRPAQTKPTQTKPAPTAAERLNEPGPEAQQLARSVGTWDVVNTLQPSPDAPAQVITGLRAERRMIGAHLQEIMRPAPGSPIPDFQRISYLFFNRVEGRWQYVSLDTRLPVGIMPATSFDLGTGGTITLVFEPLGFVGLGPAVDGTMMRSNLVITHPSEDHEVAEQYWTMADGTGRQWRAVRYDYTRTR